MTELKYQAEFASGVRADLTLSMGGMNVEWTPDIPKLTGEEWRRFVASYQDWRNSCVADFAKRSGMTIAVVDL